MILIATNATQISMPVDAFYRVHRIERIVENFRASVERFCDDAVRAEAAASSAAELRERVKLQRKDPVLRLARGFEARTFVDRPPRCALPAKHSYYQGSF